MIADFAVSIDALVLSVLCAQFILAFKMAICSDTLVCSRQYRKKKEGYQQASHKRSLDGGSTRGDSSNLRGPGGGAIEGPPLLGRISAGSAHGGLEYYR